MIKQKFHIPQMHCPSCAMLVEGIEEDLEGIKMAKANVRSKTLVVEHDESVSTDQIISAVEQVSGYRAVLDAD